MALINCPFCGKLVSEEADKCPHCGANLKSDYLCPECGTKLENFNQPCPKCGCPPEMLKKLLHQNNIQKTQLGNSKRSSTNWIVIVIFVIAVAVAGAILLNKKQNKSNLGAGDNIENTEVSTETDNSESKSSDQEETEENDADEQVLLTKLQESDNGTTSFTSDLARDKEKWYMILFAESENKKTGRAYVGGSDNGLKSFIPDFVFLYEITDNRLKLSHGGAIPERNPVSGYIIKSYSQEFDLEISSDGNNPVLTGIVPGDRSHNSREIRFFNNYCSYAQKLRNLIHW